MTKLVFIFIFFIPFIGSANDGAYYCSGNHLIPIFETDVSVKKEILTIKKLNGKFIEVTVYYEFFNPKEEKEILVGFEAFSPQGDADPRPKLGNHPYMRDFTVRMNGEHLLYDIAYVSDSIATEKDQIKSLDIRSFKSDDDYYGQFYYVYHFNAKFKKGLNKLVHTYTYDISSSVDTYFAFDYILTAANSWSNGQIDDFTLILDLGECEEFSLGKTFFDEISEWTINGLGKMTSVDKSGFDYPEYEYVNCVVQNGNLIFQKLNFKPKGEIYVWLTRQYYMREGESNYNPSLSYSYYYQNQIDYESATGIHKKILRNLPFARRGYIFQNEEIQKFYSKQSWYMPNPNYASDTKTLHPLEIEWLNKF